MPSPQSLLSCLVIGAVGAAGILRGLHEKSSRAPAKLSELEIRLNQAGEEIEMLKRENESLRSLARGGGKVTVPKEFIDSAEQEFGLRFLSSPVIHRIAPDELRDRITAATESGFGPSGLDDRQMAYTLIGWLRPGEDLLTQLTIAHSTDTHAWLDAATGEGWMLEMTNLKNIPDQAALAGLLAEILFHQHFPLAPGYPGDDADRARTALHRGTAAGAEARFLTEAARTMGFMPMNQNKTSQQLLASLSPFVRDLTEFISNNGKGFADSLHVSGNEALHAAFRRPPETTRAILSPGEPSPPSIALEPPITPYLIESSGQLGLLLWLKTLGGADAAREISNSWKSDRYFLFPDGENASAVLWDIELDSAASVDGLQALAATVAGSEDGQRHISIVRVSPTRLRFINTATAVSAAKLSAQ